MSALPTWRRTVVLAALTALLGMHGVSTGHEAMASLSPAPAMSTMSIMSTMPNPPALPDVHQASVPSLPAGLMATTCLALLGLGVALLLPRTGRLHRLTHLANARGLGPTGVFHWPRGPDPLADFGISRT